MSLSVSFYSYYLEVDYLPNDNRNILIITTQSKKMYKKKQTLSQQINSVFFYDSIISYGLINISAYRDHISR